MCLKFMKAVKDTKKFKENRKAIFCCDDCGHKIRLAAIKNFFQIEKQLPTYNRWGVFLYLSYFLN